MGEVSLFESCLIHAYVNFFWQGFQILFCALEKPRNSLYKKHLLEFFFQSIVM